MALLSPLGADAQSQHLSVRLGSGLTETWSFDTPAPVDVVALSLSGEVSREVTPWAAVSGRATLLGASSLAGDIEDAKVGQGALSAHLVLRPLRSRFASLGVSVGPGLRYRAIRVSAPKGTRVLYGDGKQYVYGDEPLRYRGFDPAMVYGVFVEHAFASGSRVALTAEVLRGLRRPGETLVGVSYGIPLR